MNKVTVRTIPERLMPDERNQFVQTDIQGEEWADYDSWGIEQACKLITLGYPVHLEGMAEEVKGWPQVCDGRDRFDSMVMVYGRALRIAKSSVQAGTIKEHDTPANWIKWAEGKGYSVAHLMPADAVAGNGKAGADTSPSIEVWKASARQIGERIHKEKPKLNAEKIAEKTHDEMTARKANGEPGMTGRGGKVPSASTIKRHAQKGITA